MARHRFPEGPWECVAIDLMGPLLNKDMVLVIIDYYSRYQEVKFLKTTTSAIIIGKLIEIFARLGIPKSIRVDNSKQFVSQEFKQFCDDYNIQLIKTPPYTSKWRSREHEQINSKTITNLPCK